MRRLPSDVITRRLRGKFISKEQIWPRSHTTVWLNPRGRRAYRKLTVDEREQIMLDLTHGGGVGERRYRKRGKNYFPIHMIYIGHEPRRTVHRDWRKIHGLLSSAERRYKKPYHKRRHHSRRIADLRMPRIRL
jgi:hypothetical protein